MKKKPEYFPAAELKARREALGLSQGALARHLRISRIALNRHEMGHTVKGPPIAFRRILAQLEDMRRRVGPEPKSNESDLLWDSLDEET